MARCLRCKAGNEWIEGDAPRDGVRLTKLERTMVRRAIGFVTAGEWPWEPLKRAEAKALDSAFDKFSSGDLEK